MSVSQPDAVSRSAHASALNITIEDEWEMEVADLAFGLVTTFLDEHLESLKEDLFGLLFSRFELLRCDAALCPRCALTV